MIKDLEARIKSANLAYIKEMPFLTDREYDKLWMTLYNIDPNNRNLYHTTYDETTQSYEHHHARPIYGLRKALDIDDLKPFLQRFKDHPIIIHPKYDGVGAVIYRTPINNQYQIVLFGDGNKGRDISHHIPAIKFKYYKNPFRNVELIIKNEDWNPDYGKNPRNVVSGWINSNEIPYINIVTAIDHEGLPAKILSPPFDLSQLNDKLLQYYFEWKKIYPIDGLVIKLLSQTERIKVAHTNAYYNWQIAWKPPISTKETKVTDIEFNISRSGRLVPKVRYIPVDICSTINEYATGNNAQWLRDKLICVGDNIVVGKAGEIIPQILEVKHTGTENFYLPSLCPVCKTPLKWQGRDLICEGESCISKWIKKLAYFYSDKGMNLKSIGEAMIEELLQVNSVYELLIKHPWALLNPKNFNILEKIINVWGNKRTENYLNELLKINNTKDPAHFISALGFKNMAYKKSFNYWQLFAAKKDPKLLPADFIIGVNKFVQAMKEITPFTFAKLPTIPKMTYTITGTLSANRDDIISYLSQYKWVFQNQVSKKTDLLILGLLDKQTTKLNKAKELNIPIITEDQIKEYLK